MLPLPAGREPSAGVVASVYERHRPEHTLLYQKAQRLKRVFNIDIEICKGCGGAMKIIACIEDPIVIRKILDHLDRLAPITAPNALLEPRTPPQTGLFDTI